MGHHARHEPSLFPTIINAFPLCSSKIIPMVSDHTGRCKDTGTDTFTHLRRSHIKEHHSFSKPFVKIKFVEAMFTSYVRKITQHL